MKEDCVYFVQARKGTRFMPKNLKASAKRWREYFMFVRDTGMNVPVGGSLPWSVLYPCEIYSISMIVGAWHFPSLGEEVLPSPFLLLSPILLQAGL